MHIRLTSQVPLSFPLNYTHEQVTVMICTKSHLRAALSVFSQVS